MKGKCCVGREGVRELFYEEALGKRHGESGLCGATLENKAEFVPEMFPESCRKNIMDHEISASGRASGKGVLA